MASPRRRLDVGEDRFALPNGTLRGGDGDECDEDVEEEKDADVEGPSAALIVWPESDLGRMFLDDDEDEGIWPDCADGSSNDEPSDMLDPKDRSPNSAGRSSCRSVGELGCWSKMSNRIGGPIGEERRAVIAAAAAAAAA